MLGESRQKHFPPKLHRECHHQTSLRGSGLWRALNIWSVEHCAFCNASDQVRSQRNIGWALLVVRVVAACCLRRYPWQCLACYARWLLTKPPSAPCACTGHNLPTSPFNNMSGNRVRTLANADKHEQMQNQRITPPFQVLRTPFCLVGTSWGYGFVACGMTVPQSRKIILQMPDFAGKSLKFPQKSGTN